MHPALDVAPLALDSVLVAAPAAFLVLPRDMLRFLEALARASRRSKF